MQTEAYCEPIRGVAFTGIRKFDRFATNMPNNNNMSRSVFRKRQRNPPKWPGIRREWLTRKKGADFIVGLSRAHFDSNNELHAIIPCSSVRLGAGFSVNRHTRALTTELSCAGRSNSCRVQYLLWISNHSGVEWLHGAAGEQIEEPCAQWNARNRL